jgi:hypothetical protein
MNRSLAGDAARLRVRQDRLLRADLCRATGKLTAPQLRRTVLLQRMLATIALAPVDR